MAFNWIQSKLKKQKKKDEAAQPVVAHQPTKTVFGPVPWTIWYDAGLELVCEEGRDEGRTIPLEHAFLVIGRGLTAEDHRDGWLLFTEETVSRRQAVLCWNEERNSYYLFHLDGATNGTYVDRRSGEQWRVGIGSTVEMGYLRYRIQRRLQIARASSFVLDTLERLGRGIDDGPVKTGLALTIINGEHKGNTFLLSRRYHVVHKTPNDSGDRLLERGQQPELEHDILVWNEEAQAYELVHNPKAIGATFVHAGRPSHQFDIFAAAPEAGIEVFSGSPILLREGDTVRVGSLQFRLHRHIQCLLEGSINHILQKGYIERIPTVDTLISASAAPPPERLDAPVQVPPVSMAPERVAAPIQAPPPIAEDDTAGWVDPDLAPTHKKRPREEPIVADRSEAFHTPSRRMPKVSPGTVSSSGDEPPHRKPRGGAPPRVQPTDEPLPFDIAEAPTIPRPAEDQPAPVEYVHVAPPVVDEPEMSIPADDDRTGEAETVVWTPDEAEAQSLHDAAAPDEAPLMPGAEETAPEPIAEPTPVAAAPAPPPPAPVEIARRPEPETLRPTKEIKPPVAAPSRISAPLTYVSPRPASPPPTPSRAPRSLSLSIPTRGSEEKPAPPVPPPVSAAPTAPSSAPVHAYELEVVSVPGFEPGALLTVGGATRIDVTRSPRLTFGSAEGSDVKLPADTTMTASHAVIEVTDHGLVLRPLQGMPMVNKSICVKESPIAAGDEIRLTRSSLLRLRVIE